jgi:cytochrome c biogenesis protein CcdA
MRHDVKRRLTARLVFFGGLLLMLLGCAFLLGTLAGISRISVLAAFFFIIIGSFCAFFAVRLNKRSAYLFFATFFILLGFFLFLSSLNIVPMVFEDWWPSVSIFAGLALIPAGWHRYGVIKIRYLVPSAAFIILGAVLLIFSLGIVSFSFKQFILNWWPLLIVLAGLILVLMALGTKNFPKDPKQ